MADDSNRKRKRKSDAAQSSSKKVGIERPAGDIIQIHLNETEGVHPVVLSSPGLLAPKVPFKPFAKPLNARHENYASSKTKPSTHELLLHSSTHPRLDYTASAVPLDSQRAHYVGIFNPETKGLQLVPAYHLNLRGTLRSGPKDEGLQRRTVAQQREELGREFGTKKAKKVIAARTVNAIGQDSQGKDGVQDAILESMAASALPTLGAQQQLEAELASKPIPKPNLGAKAVEEVYEFNTLVPPADARSLMVKDWQEKSRKTFEEGGEILLSHRFTAFRVAAIGKSDDVLRLKVLRYLDFVLRFHDLLQNAGRAGKKVPKKEVLEEKLSDCPESLRDSIRRRFANQNNELPKWHMDNLHTHICALSLYVDGWTTNMTNLKDDLKMENKELASFYRELGCKVGPPTEAQRTTLNYESKGAMSKGVAAVTRVARLTMPPDFPKARSGRKR